MNIKVPVSWLRDYLKTDLAAKTIAQYLTASGPSVERTEKLGEEFVFDVEVTTNRPDAFSIYGLAREANAILKSNNQKSQLVSPQGLDLHLEPDTKEKLTLDVLIKNKNLCPRFSAIIIDNVKIKPSPALIRNRLEACAVRPINNIVDISNYIMLELGQPMHAFDFDKIRGSKMIMREARAGESIKTLDGQTRKLPQGAIVIEDAERLIDLCGIMGCENSQISSRTKRVVLFVQAYDPIRIRKTTQSLAFRTEAAARFEKGIDTDGILPALSRSVYLAKKTSGAKVASELIDIYSQKEHAKTFSLNLNTLNQYLGLEIKPDYAASILENLGFSTKTTAQTISATPPSWRIKDVEAPVDLIEEIARIYGYHNLPSKLPHGEIPKDKDSVLSDAIELKKALKYLGLTEIISYSIISEEFLKLTEVAKKDAVELSNPLTEQWQYMRPTLLVSLAGIITQNKNSRDDIKLFEIAKTYLKTSDIPKQNLMVSCVLWRAQNNISFYDIKGLVENIFEILKREPKFSKLNTSKVGLDSFEVNVFEKSQSAQVKVGDTVVGTLGLLKPHINEYFEVAGPIAACELNLTTIYQLPTTNLSYKPIPKFPPVIEDISAIFAQKTQVGDIIFQIKKLGSPLVKQIEMIDLFENEKIGRGKKSITFRLYYQKPDDTPKQEEVSRYREIIIREIERIFKAQVRK